MQLPILLDRASTSPLQDQLFEQIRHLILGGKIKPNSRIIATRFLAEQVGVSRTTVLMAYERLVSEGYLTARPAVGTFVSEVLPDAPVQKRAAPQSSDTKILRQAQLHPMVLERLVSPRLDAPTCRFDFGRFLPDGTMVPAKAWLRRAHHILADRAADAAETVAPDGLWSLREALVDWLAARRGISATPEQVIIVSGCRQACAIVSRLFQSPGDRVVVESPGNEAAARIFDSRGAALVRVPVDGQGLMTEYLPEGHVSLAHVTPARQDPIGGTMPLRRREQLIAWARKAGAYVIEDYCDGEFRYDGTASLPLAAMDTHGLVFHVGAFTKTFGAGLCLGYIVAPAEFARAVGAVKSISDDGSPWMEQKILADFISDGAYDHHLRRVRRTFMARRDCLVRALKSHFGAVELIGADAGTQVTWLLSPEYPSATSIRALARARGIGVYVPHDEGLPPMAKEGLGDRALVLSYATVSEWEIEKGVAGLAQVLDGCGASAYSAA